MRIQKWWKTTEILLFKVAGIRLALTWILVFFEEWVQEKATEVCWQ